MTLTEHPVHNGKLERMGIALIREEQNGPKNHIHDRIFKEKKAEFVPKSDGISLEFRGFTYSAIRLR